MATGFHDLSPPDGVVFSATRPAVFVWEAPVGAPLTTADIKVDGTIVATTATAAVTQISNDFIATLTQPGGSGTNRHYTVTPAIGWGDTTTVEVDGLLGPIPYTQTRTLTVGEGYTPDHTSTALGRMLEQFQGSVNLRTLASSYVDQAQTFEDTAIQLLHDRNINTATGHRLDGLGQLVNIPRSGLEDEEYRFRIRVELAVLTSQGSIEDLIIVLSLLIDLGPLGVEIVEHFPKTLVMRPVDRVLTEDPDVIGALLKRTVSAATQLWFLYSRQVDLKTYTLSSGTTLETSTIRGLSNDAQSSGGYLANVV